LKRNRVVKYLFSRGTEIAVMLLLVSVFFAVLTTLLFNIFPAGITLTQILEQKAGNRSGTGSGANADIMLDWKQKEAEEQAAATLVYLGNDVKSKGSTSIAWGPAREGMKLRDHDAVQTFTSSSAQINFDARNYLTMGSNTLIVVKRMEKEKVASQRESTVVVMDGQLQGHVAAGGANPLRLNIATPSAMVNMRPGAASGPKSDFKISINPDHSSTIVVLRGHADVSAQGKTVRVSENTGIRVKQGEAPRAATPLPAPPEQSAPADGCVVQYRELPQRVRFQWAAGKAGSGYHLQIARDRAYREIVLDRVLDEPEFVHGNLKQGSYFWRVSRVEEGVEGRPGRGARLEVVQNLTPPPLKVLFPSGPVPEDRFLLSGTTAPGVKVFVCGKPAAPDAAGAFSCQVPIRRGATLVTVEAVDAAGNVSYRSAYVEGRF
jgi:hypothetical protein